MKRLICLLLQKNSSEVSVFSIHDEYFEQTATGHITNLKTPWAARKFKRTDETDLENLEDISAISEVQSNWDFEALICFVVIGGMLNLKVVLLNEQMNNY